MKKCLFIFLVIFAGCSTTKTNLKPNNSITLLKDLETLSFDAFEGRKTGTKGAEIAREYIISRLEDIGLKPYPGQSSFISDFLYKSGNTDTMLTGKNLIAYVPGKSSKIIVISAHYDHLGTVKGQVFNGADDNASGVAGLLKFATYFAKNKPSHTLIFAALDAEEVGLQGARAFVKNPPAPLIDIVLNVNMDMISHNDKGELYAAGTFKYPQLKKAIRNNSGDLKVLFGHDDPKLGHDDWTNQSDQGPFNTAGIPFIYFGVEDHKDYHKETDEYQNVNKSFYINATDAILSSIIQLDKLNLKN